MGSILREQPKNLYYLPGDHEGLSKLLTNEEIREKLIKTGNVEMLKKMGIN